MFFKDTYNEEKGEFDKLGTGGEANYGPKSEGQSISHVTNINDRIKLFNTQSPFMRVVCNEQRN
jgi:hypothetical protein